MKSLIGRLGRSARPPYMAATSLTLLLLLISAAPAFSAGITFRNEHKIPIIVQSATVVNNMVRRGAPLLIYPGKIARELNLKAGGIQGRRPCLPRRLPFAAQSVPGCSRSPTHSLSPRLAAVRRTAWLRAAPPVHGWRGLHSALAVCTLSR
jgi:hypothetical protein